MKLDDATLVKHALKREPIIIDGLSSVAAALGQMRESEHQALVIDKRDAGDEYGLISIEIIAREVLAQGRSPDRISVYEIMVKPAVVLHATMKARYALRLLTRLSLARALVVDDNNLLGWVDLADLSLALFQAPVSKAQ